MRWFALLIVACNPARPSKTTPPPDSLQPPIAARHAHQVASPNGNRDDPYFWLRDDTRQDPTVLGYLREEKAYTEQVLAPMAPLEDQMLDELRSHLAEDDEDVPVLDNGYYVYTKLARGKSRPIYARKKASLDAPEEIVLDSNELAVGHAYFKIASYALSRDGRYVAWTDDIVGRFEHALHIKDLTTGTILPDTATNIGEPIAWANDSRTLFYVGKDPTTLRKDRVYAHRVGDTHDREVLREDDRAYAVSVAATKSRRYVKIVLEATTHREVRLIDADRPDATPRVFLPREKGHIYEVDHVDDRFVMRTNDHAENFRIVEMRDGDERDRARWHDVVAARDDQLVESFAAYRGFVGATVRTGGYLRALVAVTGKPHVYVETPEAVSTTTVIDTPDPNATKLRYEFTSMISPRSVYEVDVATLASTLLQARSVPRYEKTRYRTTRIYARATDGTEIPISLMYRADTKLGTAPIQILGYGSHGISVDPELSLNMIVLADHGWVLANAHVRGGQELGRRWYEAGNLMHKMTTFTDFIAVTEHLVAHEYCARDQVFALGYSSGGLLMGVVANLRPDLYRGIVAIVPFVDVVTTMLDESLPLTTNEYDYWGDPRQKAAYDYMLSYSPYDNVRAHAYPSLYVRTALWDSQVQYFEPTKWVAKLRATKTDHNVIVLDIDMESGHGGKSDRFARLRSSARVDAWMQMIRDRPDRR